MPPKGPKPLSRNGRLPGVGMGKATRANRFAVWLKLKRVRSHIGGEAITQARLGRELGLNNNAIQRIEQGIHLPSVETVDKIAAFFGEDRDMLHLMTYHIPDDMLLFLYTTEEGERIIKQIRKLMQKIKEPTIKPYVNLAFAHQEQSRQARGHRFRKYQRMEEAALVEQTLREMNDETGTEAGADAG